MTTFLTGALCGFLAGFLLAACLLSSMALRASQRLREARDLNRRAQRQFNRSFYMLQRAERERRRLENERLYAERVLRVELN